MFKSIKLPMQLTLLRIILGIPIVYFAAESEVYSNDVMTCMAIFLFMVASITDYYDGYFARKMNLISNAGKFLDPVADKILVSSLLVLFVYQDKVDIVMVILFITRDNLISGIRAAASADGIVISAQTTGKWKAALQMISIPMIMVNHDIFGLNISTAGYYLLWFSVALSLLSGWQYIQLYLYPKEKV